jgi:hypothetical protein
MRGLSESPGRFERGGLSGRGSSPQLLASARCRTANTNPRVELQALRAAARRCAGTRVRVLATVPDPRADLRNFSKLKSSGQPGPEKGVLAIVRPLSTARLVLFLGMEDL